MGFSALIGLAVLQALLAISPGPATVLSIRTAATQGVRAGVVLAIGYGIAILIWATAAIMGLSLLFEIAPWLQTGLRVAGGLFLIWIAVSLWRGAATPMPSAPVSGARGTFAILRLGILTDLANPKALAYFAAVFSSILPVEPTWWDIAAILAIVFAVEAVWYSTVALVFSRRVAASFYARCKFALERIFGVILGGIGTRLTFNT